MFARHMKQGRVALRRGRVLLERSLTLGFALIVALALTTIAAAASGALDTTFGSGGKVLTNFSANGDEALAVAIQSDGRIVAVGDGYDDQLETLDFALARYLP